MPYSTAGEGRGADFDDGKRGRVPGSKMPRLWGKKKKRGKKKPEQWEGYIRGHEAVHLLLYTPGAPPSPPNQEPRNWRPQFIGRSSGSGRLPSL